jgi:hypothetical protein
MPTAVASLEMHDDDDDVQPTVLAASKSAGQHRDTQRLWRSGMSIDRTNTVDFVTFEDDTDAY